VLPSIGATPSGVSASGEVGALPSTGVVLSGASGAGSVGSVSVVVT